MKGIETGKDKVKKICDVLRQETLEPAKKEAEALIERAKSEAQALLNEAKLVIDRMMTEARTEIEKQKSVAQSALHQACRQSLETLRLQIEEKLFNQELAAQILQQTQDPKVLATLITAVVKALEKEGTDADLSAYIPAAVPAPSVNAFLAQEILSKLKENSVLLSPIGGGVEVKLHKNQITLDLSDVALKELVAKYLRKDFRSLLFG